MADAASVGVGFVADAASVGVGFVADAASVGADFVADAASVGADAGSIRHETLTLSFVLSQEIV